MDRRGFIESLKEDIALFIEQEYEDYTPTRKELYSELRYSWVTGGDSGFYGSGKEARRSCDDLETVALLVELCEAGDPFGGKLDAAQIIRRGPDSIIVTIRTCLLFDALCEIWEEA